VPEEVPSGPRLARLREALTPEDRSERDRLLYRLKTERSMTYPTLSEMFGLSERQVQRLVRERRRELQLDAWDIDRTREVIEETLEGLDNLIEQFAVLAANSDGATRLGALRERRETLLRRLETLQTLGVLPHDLGQFTVRLDLEESASRMIEAFKRLGVSEAVQEQVIDAMMGQLPAGELIEGTAEEEAA
jgi:hypothetical protein